jgi:hypothetical protein
MDLRTFIAAGFARLVAAINNANAASRGVHAREATIRVGAYISASLNATNLTAVGSIANRMDFMPFIPARRITVNELAIEVTTLIAGSQALLAIYDSNVNGLPTNLIVGSAAALDCSTIGVKSSVIPETPMNAGQLYWLAILTSSTQSVRAIGGAACHPIEMSASGASIVTLKRGSSIFANGLPAVAPGTVNTSVGAPWIRLTVAGL